MSEVPASPPPGPAGSTAGTGSTGPTPPRVRQARHTAKQRAWRIGTVVVCLLAGVLLGHGRSYSHGEDIRNRSVDLSAWYRGRAPGWRPPSRRRPRLQSQIDALAGSDLSPQVAKALARRRLRCRRRPD